jgi:hypothetical protein
MLWLVVSIPASTTEFPNASCGLLRPTGFNAPVRQGLRRKSAAKDGSSWQIVGGISGL